MKNARLQSVIPPNPRSLEGQCSIADGLKMMADLGISSVIVVDDNGAPIGIFTEHDALKVVSEKINLTNSISTVMTIDPFCVDENLYLHDAYILMEERGYRHLVVVDSSGKFCGVVSEGDFLRQIGFEEVGKFRNVSDAMSDSPLIVTLKTTLFEAASLMQERKVNYAVVLEGMNPIGVITERDIARHYVEQEVSDRSVEHLLRRDYRTIKKDTPLQDAAALMEEHGIHQLIVVDENGVLCGLLSRHDVLHAVHGAYFEFLIRVIDQKNETIAKIGEHKQELKIQKESIEKNALKLRKLFEALPDAVALIDSKTMKAVEFNRSAYEHLGYSAEEFAELRISDYDVVESEEETRRRINAIAQNGHDSFETRHRGKNGEQFYMWVNVVSIELDDHPYMIAVFRDITERKRYEQQLETLANYDPLTHLSNRALLMSHLDNSVIQAKRNGAKVALVMFDLDRFKDINDSYGHSTGDELLKEVAERLKVRMRDGDLIARLGGGRICRYFRGNREGGVCRKTGRRGYRNPF